MDAVAHAAHLAQVPAQQGGSGRRPGDRGPAADDRARRLPAALPDRPAQLRFHQQPAAAGARVRRRRPGPALHAAPRAVAASRDAERDLHADRPAHLPAAPGAWRSVPAAGLHSERPAPVRGRRRQHDLPARGRPLRARSAVAHHQRDARVADRRAVQRRREPADRRRSGRGLRLLQRHRRPARAARHRVPAGLPAHPAVDGAGGGAAPRVVIGETCSSA